jgi:signal transduction histidine kinase
VSGPFGRLNLALAAERHCYRLVLDGGHNAVEHADARAINTRITADGTPVIVPVTGDGHGLDPAVVQPCHLGLRTMRERAAAIGATLDVISAPGEAPPSGSSCPGSPVICEPAASPAAGA